MLHCPVPESRMGPWFTTFSSVPKRLICAPHANAGSTSGLRGLTFAAYPAGQQPLEPIIQNLIFLFGLFSLGEIHLDGIPKNLLLSSRIFGTVPSREAMGKVSNECLAFVNSSIVHNLRLLRHEFITDGATSKFHKPHRSNGDCEPRRPNLGG